VAPRDVAARAEFIDLVKDLLAGALDVSARRMFSGSGLYADGVIFALVIGEALYLKTDDESRRAFESEGLSPFSFTRAGRRIETSYWRAPDRLLDDADEMQVWALRALAVAKRAGQKPKPRKSPSRSGRS